MHSFTVSVGQELKSDFAKYFWLKVTHEIIAKILARAAVISRLDWVWKIDSQGGSQIGVGWWQEASVITLANLSLGFFECPHYVDSS